MPDSLTDRWHHFRAARPVFDFLHLNTAAAGRQSRGTLRASAAHLEREAASDAYMAEAEARPVLMAGRAALAGLLGVEPEGIAFTESATAALSMLLRAWPLPAGATVAVPPSDWGPALDAFADQGLRITMLAVDGDGVIDLDALRRLVAAAPPALVHLTPVASHRPLVQPAEAVVSICHEAGVPLWADAAQALGHVDADWGADAVYATSRKWLAGPRGVGVIGVSEPWWPRLRPRPSEVDRLADAHGPSLVRMMESREGHIAGRVGLCAAVADHIALGPREVRERLAAVGRLTREALAGVRGWEVLMEAGDSSAITALRPAEGQDVTAVREFLLAEHRIITSVAHLFRAPHDMTEPLLRISPHVDCLPADLAVLRQALTAYR
jgi:pyridoxal 5-phosphate dependent beta-lyase